MPNSRLPVHAGVLRDEICGLRDRRWSFFRQGEHHPSASHRQYAAAQTAARASPSLRRGDSLRLCTAISRPCFFTEGIHLNWDLIQGHWKQAASKAKEQWGKLTDDDIDVVAGRRGQLVGKIQERYGVAGDEAEKQLSEWQRKATGAWFTKDEDRP
jgi:uncharacterized protein YjbJ (UPF0337 family)